MDWLAAHPLEDACRPQKGQPSIDCAPRTRSIAARGSISDWPQAARLSLDERALNPLVDSSLAQDHVSPGMPFQDHAADGSFGRDAAHVHPPEGGQGLQTGMQDAVNLVQNFLG